jgi:hypothetical protein
MEVKGSPAKLIGLLAIGALLTVASAALAFRRLPATPRSVVWGWVGLAFFGLCTAICLWRLRTAGRTIVTVTPRGIKDVRLTADVVPWSAVRDISTAVVRSQEFIVLAVDPSFEQRLALTLIAKWTRGPNRALGIDGLCVSAIGLKIDHDALFESMLDPLAGGTPSKVSNRGVQHSAKSHRGSKVKSPQRQALS